MVKFQIKIVAGLAMWFILSGNAPVVRHAEINQEEYAYKAAFLYRFTEYMEWENINRSQTFDFAVMGKSAIASQMNTIAKEHKIQNKKMIVKEFETLDEIGLPHILFVSENTLVPLKTIVSKFAGKPVLVVTESEGSAEKGHINFFVSENKLKFEIKLKSVNKSGIKISSQLLQHAIIINE